MATSCNWMANSNSNWPLRTGLKVKVNAIRLSCWSISSVWSKCSVILQRRKWSWTILYFIGSLLHFVRVALYGLRIAQRTHRLSDSDRWRDNTVQEVLIPKSAYYIETIMAILNTNNDFPVQIGVQWREHSPYYRYKLLHDWFHSCSQIQSILGFESSVLEKRVDNPRRYLLRIVCNQIVVTNGTIRRVLSMPTYYYTFSEFIDAVGSEMVNVLPLVSMTIEEEYVKFNV